MGVLGALEVDFTGDGGGVLGSSAPLNGWRIRQIPKDPPWWGQNDVCNEATAYAITHSLNSTSACSKTVCVAFSCLSGG